MEYWSNENSIDGKSVALGEKAVQVLSLLKISCRLPLDQT